jgi:hypothetical protein
MIRLFMFAIEIFWEGEGTLIEVEIRVGRMGIFAF